MILGLHKYTNNAVPLKGRSGGSGGGSNASSQFGGALFKAHKPGIQLETVDVEEVYRDWQQNGLTNLTPGRLQQAVDFIENAIASGERIIAPRLTFRSDEGFDITDGRNRVAAFRQLGIRKIKAYVDR